MTPSLAEFRSLRWSAGGLPATRLVSQRIGAVFAWAAGHLGLTPSQVTLCGTGIFLATACLYAALPPGGGSMAVVLVLFQIGYGLDCADGQLARATGRTSAMGAWLDVACDFVRNVALAFAIAFWLIRNGIALPLALVACAVLLCGLVVQLHTGTFLSRHATTTAPPAESASATRTAVTSFIDTTTQLALLALLRLVPGFLGAYAALTGLLFIALAGFLVRRRLRPAPAAAR